MAEQYFNEDDFASLSTPTAALVQDKVHALHSALRRRLRELNWDLHPNWAQPNGVAYRSAARIGDTGALQGTLALDYLRSHDQASLVERLMGRERPNPTTTDIRRHPVVEVRLSGGQVVVELLVSPAAWWDQRNIVGKLSIPRHFDTLRSTIQRMPGDFRFGFWNGLHLSDVHLTAHQLIRGTILTEWLSTFCDGSDWLRVGVWYAPDNPALNTEQIVPELTHRIGALYRLYTFVAWTSNNNYHSFYPGSADNGKAETRM